MKNNDDSFSRIAEKMKKMKKLGEAQYNLSKKGVNKQSLGRGLSALLGDTITENNIDNTSFLKKVMEIEIKYCLPSKYQARKIFDHESLHELSLSIKEKGIIQPIVIRELSKTPLQYEIIAGERRVRASKIAGLPTIPAIIMDLSDTEVMEIGLIENLQRKNLNVVEEAVAYNSLYNDFHYTHDKIASIVGKSRSYITNYLRILKLPAEVLEMVKTDKLSLGHAKILVSIDDPITLANAVITESLSVQETEKLVRSYKDSIIKDSITYLQKKSNKKREIEKKATLSKSTEFMTWHSKALEDYKNIKISVSEKNENSGEIKIKYNSIEELKKILQIQ